MTFFNTEIDNDTISNNIASLRGKVRRFINIEAAEAEQLLEQLRQHSRQLKGSPMLSKQLLHELRELIRTLQAEAPGMRSKEAIALKYARHFEQIFGLILDDKSDLDLSPSGIPRAL